MTSFSDLGLRQELLSAIEDLGFTQPTPIQEQAIPILLQATTDFVGLAQTGTGKTAAFGLPLLHLVDTRRREVQGLILSPTRELCLQISTDLERYSAHMPQLRICAVYGGANIQPQIRTLRDGVQIVVATPGRLIDLIDRGAIKLDTVSFTVLDEADEMLNMGFRDDLDYILSNTTGKKSTWLFSATMPNEVRRIAAQYMTEPAEITVGKKNQSAANITHNYFVTTQAHRYEVLKRIVDSHPGMYGIIFTRTKMDAQEITEKLIREGYDIDALHGDLSQQQRDKVMSRFREKSLQLLIATDVAARGIDVEGITHVINYALPDDIEVYTHRSGRTARAGRSGICLSIVHQKEQHRIRDLERMLKVPFNKLPIPNGTEVCENQFMHFITKIVETPLDHGEYERYLPQVEDVLREMSKEELLQRVVALEFSRFLAYYKNAPDLNLHDSRDRKKQDQDRSNSSGDEFVRIFFNIGSKDGFYKASFLQFALDASNISKTELGRIDLREVYTHVEINPSLADQMINAIHGLKVNGRRIRVEYADRNMNKSKGGGSGSREGFSERPPRTEGESSGGGGGYFQSRERSDSSRSDKPSFGERKKGKKFY